MERSIAGILAQVREVLETARFGLEDMRGPVLRRRAGYRNAVVFGRMVTFNLQNLSGKAPGFSEWYAEKQAEMRDNEVFRFFHDERTRIEKQAGLSLKTVGQINNFDLGRVLQGMEATRPPAATSMFIGDPLGGAGWIVKAPDGTEEKYYVEIPPEVLDWKSEFHISPKKGDPEDSGPAIEYLTQYLDKLEEYIAEAEQRFGRFAAS